jgi:hypothetical protein
LERGYDIAAGRKILMKLRIQGNLLRLRLTQKEVACLHDHGLVESAIQFPPGRALNYSVVSSPDAAEVSVDYRDDSIRVILPRAVETEWTESSQVSVVGQGSSGIQILVEKDFQCLHKPEELDPDAYPNPLAAATKRSGD